jgi:pimeloyl-ACP methyl ester carboxylesterase
MTYLAKAAFQLAGERAFRMFCTPALSSVRTPDHHLLTQRARYHLRPAEWRRIRTSGYDVQTYTFRPITEPVASVLLVHGWTGEAAFMGAFAERLRRAGYRAVIMDMPAHGLSGGQEATLFDCAQAIVEVAEALGGIEFALGHSIGAMALLTAGEGQRPLSNGYPFEAYALVAMPDAISDITQKFGGELGLSPAAQRVFERQLELIAGRRILEFSGTTLLKATGRPTLLIHSRDDLEVPFNCASNMVQEVPNTGLSAMDGVGHRAILYAPPAIRAAVAFFNSQVRHNSCSSSRDGAREAIGTMIEQPRGQAGRVAHTREKLLRT